MNGFATISSEQAYLIDIIPTIFQRDNLLTGRHCFFEFKMDISLYFFPLRCCSACCCRKSAVVSSFGLVEFRAVLFGSIGGIRYEVYTQIQRQRNTSEFESGHPKNQLTGEIQSERPLQNGCFRGSCESESVMKRLHCPSIHNSKMTMVLLSINHPS